MKCSLGARISVNDQKPNASPLSRAPPPSGKTLSFVYSPARAEPAARAMMARKAARRAIVFVCECVESWRREKGFDGGF